MVKSAKAVMADRSLALGTLQSARSDVDAKRTKLAKLRGTPGIKVWSIGFLLDPLKTPFAGKLHAWLQHQTKHELNQRS